MAGYAQSESDWGPDDDDRDELIARGQRLISELREVLDGLSALTAQPQPRSRVSGERSRVVP